METVRLLAGDEETVMAMSDLFDGPAIAEHTRRFLVDDRHHLLIAREGDDVVGFVSGVEMTHPDKGTEMFLYELAVDDRWQRRGVGSSLVAALRDLAHERGCYGMWVLTDDDNDAALATYTSAGGSRSSQVMLDWDWSRP
ncbi:MAG: aminoglycoside 3-N-acetyltransferase [Acidimicrobiaceae bacterium]